MGGKLITRKRYLMEQRQAIIMRTTTTGKNQGTPMESTSKFPVL
jgi:hypothetical protein